VLGAYGNLATGESNSLQYQAQANAADYNAAVSRFMAKQYAKASGAEQLGLRRQQRQFLGTQRAAIAQAGIGTGGSAADVVEESTTLAELDAMNLAYEGASRFMAAMTQADMLEATGIALRAGSTSAKAAGRIGAYRSLLSGAASIWGG
jgi:hypothetical protein